MPIGSMPAIDVNTCGEWTENQVDAYQQLPYHLAEIQIERKKEETTFSKVITKKRRWKQNQGSTLRGVKTNPSPHLRQFFWPKPISVQPNTDVINVTESTTEAQVYNHEFESVHFPFMPSFADFLDHIEHHGKDIMSKIERANEIFLRGAIFQMSPKVGFCKADGTVEIVSAPYWSGTGQYTAAIGKTQAWLAANAIVKTTGNLKLSCIEMAMTIAETDLGIPFFQGSELSKENQPLDGKFLWTLDSEAYNQFVYDQWVRENKNCNFDIVTNGFRGSIFGRATTRIEQKPLRYKADASQAAPEVRVNQAGEYNHGETEPNPDYAQIETGVAGQGSPYGVAWLIGANGYEIIDTGPPPSMFTGGKFPNAPGMNWNGKPILTKHFNIKCLGGENGDEVIWKANTYGRFLKYINESTFGIIATQRRNMIPIFYLRRRGPGAPAVAEVQ